MAMKYERKGFRARARGTHGGLDAMHLRRSLDPKQRLLILYLGVAAVLAGVLVVNTLTLNRNATWREPQAGQGVIVEKKELKSIRGTPVHLVAIRVEVGLEASEDPESSQAGEATPGPTLLVAENVVVDLESWKRIDEGSTVWATFQVDALGKRVRVLSLTLREPEAPGSPILP